VRLGFSSEGTNMRMFEDGVLRTVDRPKKVEVKRD
jgi:hypothetical protein